MTVWRPGPRTRYAMIYPSRPARQSGRRLDELGVVLPEPPLNLSSQASGQVEHLGSLLVGDCSGSLVSTPVPLLAEQVEASHKRRRGPDRKAQGLDDAVVVRLAGGPIATGCQSRGRSLQGGVVGDAQPPVRAESRQLGVGKVAFDQGEKVEDLGGRWLMLS